MSVSQYPLSISESSRSNPARPRLLRMEPLEDRLLLSARAVNAVNQFGLDVYEHLQNEQGNLFFSPLSIATGLAMAYEGAAGQTAAEMEQMLHLGSEPGIHTSFQNLIATLESQEVTVPGMFPWLPPEHQLQLDLANAMWPQVGLPLESSFVDIITTSYDGYAESLNYSNPQQAEDTINDWVSQQTQGKIPDLVSNLSPATVMVLTNSVYFKGLWESPFDPRHTNTGQFTLADGQTVSTPTMYTEMFAYRTELDDFQILDLPFVEDNSSMVLVLPPVADPSAQLTNEVMAGIDNWFAGPRDLDVTITIITLPKFQTTVATSLNQLLIGLGMPTAFDRVAADFSGMTSVGVFIEKVFHKATIEVNEQGTEAAAATEINFGICFVAGTPVLTTDGEKPIEELKVGDQVLARDELNVEGTAEHKVVVKTFQSNAEIVELHVDGQVIRTTGPHRFFAKGKGWTPASDLQEKDLLSTIHRDWAEVGKVVSTGDEVAVYNLTVADHHTYFVGSESWGFAVWAHNSCGNEPEFNANRPFHMLIRDNATSAITFMGRIDDPTQLQNDLDPTVVETNADFDSDGDVDGFDFLTWQRGYGITTGAELTDGDSDGNGTVDATDMAEWAAAYGENYASVSALLGNLDADNDVDGRDLLSSQQGYDTIYDTSDLAALQNNYGQIAQQLAAASNGRQEDSGDLIAPVSNASLLDAVFSTQWLGVSHDQTEAAVMRQTITEEVFADSYKSASRTTAAYDLTDGISARTTPEQAEDFDQSWLSDNLLEKVFGESASRLA